MRRVLFQNILDNDGILQRELIVKTGFSEPKVSRLLDKAERRGIDSSSEGRDGKQDISKKMKLWKQRLNFIFLKLLSA